MAVARPGQSNTMLYTVITFVALFIIAAILAVIFYLKSEDWRNQYIDSQRDTSELATQNQVRNIGTLVGQKEQGQSKLGQLLGYIDRLYVIFVGSQPQETSAEVKMSEMQTEYNDILVRLPEEMVLSADANQTGALKLLEIYDSKLKQKQELADQLTSQLDKLNKEYDLAKQEAAKREEELRNQIRAEQKKIDSIQQSHSQFRELMDKEAAAEEIQKLTKQRDESRSDKDKTEKKLQDIMSELASVRNELDKLHKDANNLSVDVNATEALALKLKSRPKEDIAAYKPDGHIITIDISSNVVFIDIGIEDKVYPGLTFSVYDKNASIPTDGSSKAEIEVFSVDKNTAIARINKSSKKNPVAEGDVIINLVWDSKTVNRFVVAGEFDFNGDGNIDSDGAAKIKQLIENWGGKVEDVVTIDTDFVVLGTPPQVRKKPTLDEVGADPMATEKYETSIKASEQYLQAKSQAKDLYVPIFSVKRFLNFIGYGSLASGTKAK